MLVDRRLTLKQNLVFRGNKGGELEALEAVIPEVVNAAVHGAFTDPFTQEILSTYHCPFITQYFQKESVSRFEP